MDAAFLLIQLFLTFFIVGLFTIGGGYAMLSLIQSQVVAVHGWLSESTFTNIVAISQMTPGPIGINCATYTGYEVLLSSSGSHFLGIIGSLTTTAAIVLPSFVIMLLLVRFYRKFHQNNLFGSVLSWLRPAVAGLIGAAALILMFKVSWTGIPILSRPSISLIRENFIDWKSWGLFAASLVASFLFKTNPIWLIIGGGILGLLLY